MLKGLSVAGGDTILFLRSPSTRCENVTLTPGVAVQGRHNLSPGTPLLKRRDSTLAHGSPVRPGAPLSLRAYWEGGGETQLCPKDYPFILRRRKPSPRKAIRSYLRSMQSTGSETPSYPSLWKQALIWHSEADIISGSESVA